MLKCSVDSACILLSKKDEKKNAKFTAKASTNATPALRIAIVRKDDISSRDLPDLNELFKIFPPFILDFAVKNAYYNTYIVYNLKVSLSTVLISAKKDNG